jgi:hypothetical protein
MAFLAIRAGLRDARAGRSAYGGTVAIDAVHRSELLRRWKLFIIAGTASSARMALDAHNFLLDGEMDEFGATV